MGTTAVAVMFREQQPWVAHVGDSPLPPPYKLEQMTEDHTLVAVAFKFGDITPEEAGLIPTDIFYTLLGPYRSAFH